MIRRTLWGAALALISALPSHLTAQDITDRDIREALTIPPELAAEVLAIVNDPGTLQMRGDGRIPADRRVQGPIAVLAGELTLNGTVAGDVIVFNGDLVMGPGAAILGDLIVVGGGIDLDEESRLEGMALVYDRAFPLVLEDGAWEPRGDLRFDRPGLQLGRSRLVVKAGRGYNRVEGLPVLIGPSLRTPGEHPLRFEAQAIVRSETFALDEFGYVMRLEQSFGGPARPRLGLSAYSQVQTVEDRGISDLESSFAAFLFRRDLRDHFQNTGWSAYLEMQRVDLPLRIRLSYQDEDHFEVEPGDPLTVFRRGEEWRAMPLAARGDFRSVSLDARLDTRNDPDNPTDGWLINARVLRGLSGSLQTPGVRVSPTGPTVEGDAFSVGTDGIFSGTLDIRRYARVDPDSDLRLRLEMGGSLNGQPLPPQLQRTLGGVGSLPAFTRFELDCGARANPVFVDNENGDPRRTFANYGCDRTVLFQAQYRHELDFGLNLGGGDRGADDWRLWPDVDLTLAWVLFMDAGRGWSMDDTRPDGNTLLDAGTGLQLGDLGAYLAYPFAGDDREVRFTMRLQHRF